MPDTPPTGFDEVSIGLNSTMATHQQCTSLWTSFSRHVFDSMITGTPLWSDDSSSPLFKAKRYEIVRDDTTATVAHLPIFRSDQADSIQRALRDKVPFLIRGLASVASTREELLADPQALQRHLGNLNGTHFRYPGPRFWFISPRRRKQRFDEDGSLFHNTSFRETTLDEAVGLLRDGTTSGQHFEWARHDKKFFNLNDAGEAGRLLARPLNDEQVTPLYARRPAGGERGGSCSVVDTAEIEVLDQVQIGARAYNSDMHFDEFDNTFVNLIGSKRALIAHPYYYEQLYYPDEGTQADSRKSAVSPNEPDYAKHPRLAETRWLQAPMLPGDVLHLPALWHHVFDVIDAAKDADPKSDMFVAVNRFVRETKMIASDTRTEQQRLPVPTRCEPASTVPAAVGHTKLNDGRSIPSVGLGLYKSEPGQETYRSVATAIQLGYRHFDTAMMYANEGDVGSAIADSLLSRDDVWVTSKLLVSADLIGSQGVPTSEGDASAIEAEGHANELRRHRALERIRASAAALGGYVDLMLIHSPHAPTAEARVALWLALEDAQRLGLVHSIGVSNYGAHHLQELLDHPHTSVIPAVNQMELHPFLTRPQVEALCVSVGIALVAYSPLAKGRRMEHSTIRHVARAHDVSAAQVMIRWALQRGYVVLPKASSVLHKVTNLQLHFNLSATEMARLNELDEGFITGWDPASLDLPEGSRMRLRAVPAWLCGVWKREWIQKPYTATRASTQVAYYLQTPLAFVDVRDDVGATPAHAFAGLARVDDEEAGFQAGVGNDGPIITWHSTHTLGRPLPLPEETWRLAAAGELPSSSDMALAVFRDATGELTGPPEGMSEKGQRWLEYGLPFDDDQSPPFELTQPLGAKPQHIEAWTLVEAATRLAAARRADAMLVVVGDWFGYARGRGAAHAEQFCIGRVSSGWVISHSTDPSLRRHKLVVDGLDGWQTIQPTANKEKSHDGGYLLSTWSRISAAYESYTSTRQVDRAEHQQLTLVRFPDEFEGMPAGLPAVVQSEPGME